MKPEQVHQLVTMRLAGMPQEEIAQHLGVSRQTVSVRLRLLDVQFSMRDAMQPYGPELRAIVPLAIEACRGALTAKEWVDGKKGRIEVPNHRARLGAVRRLRDLLEMAEGKQAIEQVAPGAGTVRLTEMLVQIREVEAAVYSPQVNRHNGHDGNGNGHKIIDIPKSE